MFNNTVRSFFSVYGSNFSMKTEDGHLCYYHMAIQGGCKFLQIDNPHDNPVEFDIGEIVVRSGSLVHKTALFGADGALLKGSGDVLHLSYVMADDPYAYAVYENDAVRLCCFKKETYMWFEPVKGSIDIKKERIKGKAGEYNIRLDIIPDETGEYEVRMRAHISPGKIPPCNPVTYDECVESAKDSFNEWFKAYGEREDLKEAIYHLWANMVPKGGRMEYPTMFVSKGGMCAVWTWDNCFHALGLAKAFPEAALDQLMVSYQFQDEYGCDHDLHTYEGISHAFTKPPVQGFLYRLMMEANPYFCKIDSLKRIYYKMVKNTMWWLNYRGNPPTYWHGNDSGADNATCFDDNFAIASPDLAALLSVQCDFLADTAKTLGLETDHEIFKGLSEKLLKVTVDNFWNGEDFCVINASNGNKIYTKSLLQYRCVVLADRLPKEIADFLADKFKNEHLGEYGLASEALQSVEFDGKSYWRGSAWAPDQIIFAAALKRAGYTDLADEIAKRFISVMRKSGHAENYNPITGEPQYCRGFSWTSAADVFFNTFFKK